MKRVGNLWGQITDIENIKLAHKQALSSLMAYKGWAKTASAKMLWRKNVSRRLINTFPVQLKGAI